MRRNAQIVAETVAVLCPHCGEAQPNPDNGAESWTPTEVKASEGDRACVSCDAEFRLVAQGRVSVFS